MSVDSEKLDFFSADVLLPIGVFPVGVIAKYDQGAGDDRGVDVFIYMLGRNEPKIECVRATRFFVERFPKHAVNDGQLIAWIRCGPVQAALDAWVSAKRAELGAEVISSSARFSLRDMDFPEFLCHACYWKMSKVFSTITWKTQSELLKQKIAAIRSVKGVFPVIDEQEIAEG